MTDARSRIRTVAWWSAVFAVFGAVQAVAVAVLVHAGWRWGLNSAVRLALASLMWVPVAITAMALVRSHRSARGTAALLATGAVLAVFLEPRWIALLDPFGTNVSASLRTLGRADTNLITFAAILSVTWLIEVRRRQAHAEMAAAQLQASLVDAQLHILTLQLHPHFLFNALNLISQLAYENVTQALATLDGLKRLLVESVLHADRREITLAEEFAFVRAYLDIQRARFGARLTASLQCAPEAAACATPHLLLQPLVENALVHGLEHGGRAGNVHVAARVTDGRVLIAVTDDGVGAPAAIVEGLGLRNTRGRLRHFYGIDHRFELRNRNGGGTEVVIDIPCRDVRPELAPGQRQKLLVDEPPVEDGLYALGQRIPLRLSIVAGWALVAALWTLLEATAARVGGMPFDVRTTVLGNSMSAGFWLIMTPAVMTLARLARGKSMPARLAMLAGLGGAAVGLHLSTTLLVLRVIAPARHAAVVNTIVGWAVWDTGAVVAIVALAEVLALAARNQEVRIEMIRSRTGIRSARLASLRLHLQPAILINCLHAVRNALSQDVTRAESVIARAGDLLRRLLDDSAGEAWPLADEMDLLQTYTDIVWPLAYTDRDQRPPRWHYDDSRTTVPAGSFSSLAAAMGGWIADVHVETGDRALEVRLTAMGGKVNEQLIAAIRLRLESQYAGQVNLAAPGGDGATATLIVPRRDDLFQHIGDRPAFTGGGQ